MSEPLSWQGVPDRVPYRIRTGVWTDWSRGLVMGQTLTLDRTTGSLLIAFTAIFISLTASSFWRIVRLALYRSHSTPEPRDTLHHQRQVLLRNSITAPASLWAFVQLGWTWRRSIRRPWLRTLPIILYAICSIAAFAAAGGLSSRISSSLGRAVLIDGAKCGLTNQTKLIQNSPSSEIQRSMSELLWGSNLARHYAEQCYTDRPTGVFNCMTYVQPRLSTMIDRHAPCPFSGGICRSNDSNLRLDSGPIDSHDHLGLNSPLEDRFKIRLVAQCAPLVSKGYTKLNVTQNRNYTQYYYGPYSDLAQSTFSPYTYRTEDFLSQLTVTVGENPNELAPIISPEAKLWNAHSFVRNGTPFNRTTNFQPIPQLQRPDGDLSLHMLSANGLRFLDHNDDLWYGLSHGSNDRPEDNISWEAASPLACLMQTQLCNFKGQCGPLASFLDAIAGAAPLSSSDPISFEGDAMGIGFSESDPPSRSTQRFFWLLSTLLLSEFFFDPVASDIMPTSRMATPLFPTKVPKNQWQTDMAHIWAISLAGIQAAFVTVAVGDTDPGRSISVTPAPKLAPIQEWCNNQKILSSDYTSFSLFWLSITYFFGLLVVATSYIIEPIYGTLWRCRHYKERQFLEWASDETLQLHRAAHQGIGSGIWQGFTDAVPRNIKDEPLADLALYYTEADHVRTMDDGASDDAEQEADARGRRSIHSLPRAGNNWSPPVESETDATPESDGNSLGQATSATTLLPLMPMRPRPRDGSGSFSRRFSSILAGRGASRPDAYELHNHNWPPAGPGRTGQFRSQDRHGEEAAAEPEADASRTPLY